MKKILFAIAFVMVMVLGANAQSDGWFKASGDDNYSGRTGASNITLPYHNEITDQNGSAPLGSGLLILTAIGAGYAVARKKRS